ncbi:MAG: hypothetical protein ACXWX9_09210 [Actinomycetota bacterium]
MPLRTARRLAVAVGGLYLLAEIALLSIGRAVSWDEAIYLSQVDPDVAAMPFVASRARGITLLALPVVQLGGSLELVRLFLALASAGALIAAYLGWTRIVGIGAAVAAFAFGSTWVALLYGSELMPNLWSALLAVAAVGVAASSLMGASPRGTLLAGGLLALLAMFRPPDAVPVLVAILIAAAGGGRLRLRTAAPLVAGVALGWIPWLVEMSVRFGGPAEAVRRAQDAAHVGTTSVGSRVVQHLALSNGPTLGPLEDPTVAIGGVVWWVALLGLTALGLAWSRHTPAFRPLLAATIAGLGLAAEYLVLIEGTAPRFLLPTYALLSLPAAAALGEAFRRLRGRAARTVFVAVAAVPWLVWQVGTADRLDALTNGPRESLQEVAGVLRAERDARPCSFASTDGFPQIEYTLGCDGRHLGEAGTATISFLEDAARRGQQVFLVTRDPETPPTVETTTELLRTLPAPLGETWYLYELVPA